MSGPLPEAFEDSNPVPCEGPPPLKFSAPPLTEGAPGAPGPLLWEAPYSCGNPAVERITGILRYLMAAAPRAPGGPARAPMTGTAQGISSVGMPAASSLGGPLAGGPSAISRQCSGGNAGAGSADPALGVLPLKDCLQGASVGPSPWDATPDDCTVVLVAPRVPTYVPPAAFCDLLLSSSYPFLQAKVLQGPSPSEYLMLLQAERSVALGALQALNGVFFGGPLGAFCELRLVRDVSLKIQTRREAPETEPARLQRRLADSRTKSPSAPPRPVTLVPIGSARAPSMGAPTGLLGARGPPPPTAAPSLAGKDNPTAARTEVAATSPPATSEGFHAREAFVSPLQLLPCYDALHFCAVCLERLTVAGPPTAAAAGAAAAASSPTPPSRGGPPGGGPSGGPLGAAGGSPCGTSGHPGGGGPPVASGAESGGSPGPCSDMPLAVLCGHSFHVSCLRKWRDVSCPVCRYQQHPLQPSCCSVCGETEGIMVCLVCGFSGCGGPQRGASQTPSPVGDTVPVFQEAANAGASAAVHGEGGPQRELRKTCHAFSHFLEMSHAHALEVSRQARPPALFSASS
ncbi:uncharacterized protein LOC113147357 [Cyclospora cayetanensis]|uniref:Uncharacterized protein LOC113147357 n=1 Tax=Cyclospora cayetanensis TaxID=88456 RepID=A0A6P6RZQ4_9EIME|nr:uncharacterized protein LOC113147357 [Cyclospora cayetanensis]